MGLIGGARLMKFKSISRGALRVYLERVWIIECRRPLPAREAVNFAVREAAMTRPIIAAAAIALFSIGIAAPALARDFGGFGGGGFAHPGFFAGHPFVNRSVSVNSSVVVNRSFVANRSFFDRRFFFDHRRVFFDRGRFFHPFFGVGFFGYPYYPYAYPPPVVYGEPPLDAQGSPQPIPGRENCREYAISAVIDGESRQVYGTACQQADGSWRVGP